MRHADAVLAAALAFATWPGPTLADSEMKQSPLMMRRAGPSCQAGNLGGDPGAGYFYRLGPCAGVDAPAMRAVAPERNVGPSRRRF